MPRSTDDGTNERAILNTLAVRDAVGVPLPWIAIAGVGLALVGRIFGKSDANRGPRRRAGFACPIWPEPALRAWQIVCRSKRSSGDTPF